MRVAFLASDYLDPTDPRSWSGLPYFIRRSLEHAGVETTILRLEDNASVGRWIRFLYWRLRGRRHLRRCETGLLGHYSRQLERRLPDLEVDAVFSPSTWLFAFARTNLPILFWTDACFGNMLDFYPSFSRLSPPSIWAGHLAEQRALDRCTRALYCSEWAAQAALAHYRVSPMKVGVVPYGGNLQHFPSALEVAAAVRARDPSLCRLLLVGVDWERKGAAIAVATVEVLQKLGLKSQLTIIGCKPPRGVQLPPFVEIVPFISKQTAEGRRRLDDYYRRSHLFIMPTRAEAFGLVFSEAAAFGVPALATDVGGLSSVIADDVTGRLFSPAAEAPEYAEYILSLMNHPGRYRAMALRAAQQARGRLSWDNSGRRVAEILEEIAHPDRSPAVLEGDAGAPRSLSER